MRVPRSLALPAFAAVAAFWALCVAVPLAAVLSRAGAAAFGSDPALWNIAGATIRQALLSASVSGALGLPLGLWLGRLFSAAGSSPSRLEGRLLWLAEALLAVPFGVPTVVAGMAWVSWLGRNGILSGLGVPLDWAYSLKAVVLAHVFYNVPWIALLVAQARRHLPPEQLEAAATLGAGRLASFRHVIWPQVKWAFASATTQALALCAMSFALVLILGGGPPVDTLETALYGRIRFGSLDISGAAACAAIELAVTLLPWAAVVALQSRSAHLTPQSFRPASSRGAGLFGAGIAVAAALLFCAPYLAALGGHPLAALSSADTLGEIAAPLRITALLALSAGAGTLALAGAALAAASLLPRGSGARAAYTLLLTLPGGVSVLVLGLGFWLAYGSWIDPFSGSFGAMAVLQVALFFPVAFRILWPVSQGAQPGLLEAAATLGASPLRAFFEVEWPRWRRPLFSALALVTAASIGEVAAVSLFYSENLIPLPLLVSRWNARYRFDEARALAGMLFLVSAAVALAVSWAGQAFKENPERAYR